MSDITVTLDDFVFQDFEVPDRINFGGRQMLKVHTLLGGKRVIDAMGSDDDPLEWSGRFRGADAVSRANTLDAKRRAGKAINLSWGEFSLTVVIAHFQAVYENPYEVPYKIELEVVEEQLLDEEPGADEMIMSDQESVDGLSTDLAITDISTPVSSMDTAMGAVSSFASATSDALSSVLDKVSSVQSAVTDKIESVEDQMASLLPLGPTHSNIAARLAGVVTAQVQDLGQAYRLYDAENYLGRLAGNLQELAGTRATAPILTASIRPSAIGGDALRFNADGSSERVAPDPQKPDWPE